MKPYLLDASIVAAAIFDPTSSPLALISNLIQNNHKLFSANLLVPEIINLIHSAYKNPTQAEKLLNSFFQLPLSLFSANSVQYKQILLQSYKQNTSLYPTTYHFLAKVNGLILLTSDKKYFHKAQSFGNIELL